MATKTTKNVVVFRCDDCGATFETEEVANKCAQVDERNRQINALLARITPALAELQGLCPHPDKETLHWENSVDPSDNRCVRTTWHCPTCHLVWKDGN